MMTLDSMKIHTWMWFVGLITFMATMMSVNLHAAPGLNVTMSQPDSSSGQYTQQVEDMRVKVQGGFIRIVRTYEEGQWSWNKRWAPIKLYGIQSPTDFVQSDEVNAPANLPFAVVRNDSAYVWDLTPTDDSQLAITDRTYIKGSKRIEVGDDGDSYTWHDRMGNKIRYEGPIVDVEPSDKDYAPVMQIASYSDKNNNTVTFNRNSQGDIKTISVDDKTILTYHYNNNKISKITDYTDRAVEYHYTGEILTSVRDVRGEVWTYHYNDHGHLNGYTDPEEFKVSVEVDANGVVLNQDHGNGKQSVETGYSKAQDLYTSRTVDAAGKVTERWYNALGQTVRLDINGETYYTVDIVLSDNSTDVRKLSGSNITQLGSHASYSRPPSISDIPRKTNKDNVYIKTRIRTDAQGDVTRTDYDQWGNIKKTTYPDGGVETKAFHPKYNLPIKAVDESGTVTEYSYDDNGNLIQLIQAKGLVGERTVQYKYDAHSNRSQVKVLGDDVTEEVIEVFTYDDYDNLKTFTDGEESLTQYTEYDAIGNLKTRIDAREKTWTKNYDAVGNLLEQTDPDSQTLEYQYDKVGKRIKSINIDNSEVIFEYQGNKLVSQTEPVIGGTSDDDKLENYRHKFEYDNIGRLVKKTDSTGRVKKVAYDDNGRVKQRIDGNNNITSYEYKGNKLSKVIYPTFSQTYQYNNRKEIVSSSINADDQLRQRIQSYDRDKRSSSQTDTKGNTSQIFYDALGREIRRVDANDGVTQYVYDDLDNLIEVIDAENRSTVFSYDKANRLISETKQQNNETTEYSYDKTGNLKTILSAKGEYTTFIYSDAGLVKENRFYKNQIDTEPLKTVSYTYNAQGIIESYDDGTTTTRYEYDAKQQITKVTVDYGLFTKSYSYSYYPNGLKHTYTNPEGGVYTYTYDGNSQLLSVDIPEEGLYSLNDYQWLAPGQITFPGGGQRQLEYDDTLRLTKRSYKNQANITQHQSTYGYDTENNITSQLNEQGNNTYDYDDLYRLTDVTVDLNQYSFSQLANEQYSYDKVGNRLSTISSQQNWLYNDNNQLTQADNISYQYDLNGNLTKKTDASNGQIHNYIYNTERRLIKIEDQNQQTIAQYYYNPFGQRLSKKVKGITTYYLYSQEGLVAEYSQAGNLQNEFHYQPDGAWMTNPLFMRTGYNEVLYYHNDHSGAPQALYNKQGQQKWQAKYTAFGQAEILNNLVIQNLRFPGQYYDAESGLHQNYFRDYEPKIGRYIQADPIGLDGGINVYGYAYQNPVRYTDPLGLWVKRCGRGLGDQDKPAVEPSGNPVRHDYLSVSGEVLSFQAGDSMIWSQGWVDKKNEHPDNPKCLMVCDDDLFDKYVSEAAAEIGEPTYCVWGYPGTITHSLGARNCQTWADDVLALAKKKIS